MPMFAMTLVPSNSALNGVRMISVPSREITAMTSSGASLSRLNSSWK